MPENPRRILLVKTSSLGDVVHNLPVASDIASAFRAPVIDWVVEESFEALPRLHRAVGRVIPVALRRWRKAWWRRETRDEIREFLAALREAHYDAVIDTQGLFKSAIVTRAAHGRRYGLDWRSSREPLAAFYDVALNVPRNQAAVERNRILASLALGYAAPASIDYGIVAEKHSRFVDARYAVLIHSTSADAKLWPEERWRALGQTLHARGIRALLPWGSAAEHERGERLRRALPDSVVLPRLPLGDLTAVLADAEYVVGVDTGLTHLAGALGNRTVGLYTATDPRRTGLYGCARASNLGGVGKNPQPADVLSALEGLS
ncbi:MAG: Lipopolysaccharide heptosyltransferase [Betaproteobacteria bacterium]|nr:Lipopolysaccharide heptosyltransferase [Betaproteobacteria bacterium]